MTDPALAKALEPMNAKCTKINELKDSNRKSPFFNHLNTFSESNAVFIGLGSLHQSRTLLILKIQSNFGLTEF